MNRKSKIIVSVVGITIVTLALLGITYAYYLTRIEGNTNTNSISVTTADLKLVYGDGNGAIAAEDIMPGTSLTKEFTVTNEGESKVDDYVVVLESVVNELSRRKDLTYNLNCKLQNGNSCGSTGNIQFPDNGVDKAIFLNSIDKDVTQYYTLYVKYANPNEDQSIDMGKEFSALVNIRDSKGIDTTGLVNPNDNLTLGNTLITLYGGKDNITEIDTGDREEIVIYDSVERTVYDSINWGTSYTIDLEGNYRLAGTIVNSSLDDCRNGTNTCGKYYIPDPDDQDGSHLMNEVTNFLESGNKVIVIQRRAVNKFYYNTQIDDAGIYKAEDNYGNSYYFRGDVTNNYVKFGSYAPGTTVNDITYNEETPMYWRIVRINGDGTIRMIYAGTTKAENGEVNDNTIGSLQFIDANGNQSNRKLFAGYMYGTISDPFGDDLETELTDSKIKQFIDSWYISHLKTKYEGYIADSVFCNDREIYRYYDAEEWGDAWEQYQIVYRNLRGVPTLVCNNKRDRFTVNGTVLGNGHLTNPIGLLTADEAIMIGTPDSNTSNYIKGNSFWTMTPIDNDGWDTNFYLSEFSDTTYGLQYYEYEVRPVINLKADVPFTIDEDGTYVITTN